MIVPPLLRTPAVRLLLVAYPALAGILPAAGRPWLTVPLCLTALAAVGALWVRALPGPPAEIAVPAARPGLAATAGLVTVPLVALVLHAVGRPIRPVPLVVACAALVTVLGAVALVRDRRAVQRAATRPDLPYQRRHGSASPPASTGRPPSSPRHSADLRSDPPPSSSPRYGRTTSPVAQEPGGSSPPSSQPPDPDRPDPNPPREAPGPSPAVPGPDADQDRRVPGEQRADSPADGSPVDAPPPDTDLSGTDLSGTDLSGTDLSGTDLSGTDLSGAGRGPARTTVAVAVPLVLAVGVGGPAVHTYLTLPHPPEPGYLSVALNGWAAAIDSPVTVPARGLVVPVRVTSAGLADTTSLLQLRIGGQVVATRQMTVAADSVRSLTVYVPALPPDGLLRNVAISVGATSIGFYARGHADTPESPGTTASAAVTGPGVRPVDAGRGVTHGANSAGGNRAGAAGAPAGPVTLGNGLAGASAGGWRGPSVSGGVGWREPVVSGGRPGRPVAPAAAGGDRTGAVQAQARPAAPGNGLGGVGTGGLPRPVRPGGVRVTPGGSHDGGDRAGLGVAAGLRPDRTEPGANPANPLTTSGQPGPVVPAGGTSAEPGPHSGAETPGASGGHADRTRTGGTKGGRAVADRGSGAADAGVRSGEGPAEPGRVTCSGKRRAVLAGERTTC